MKTHLFTPIVTRLLVCLVALTAMIQLVGCQQTDVKPLVAQPIPVHVTNPLPQPKGVCFGCIDGAFPRIYPQPRTQK